MLALGLLFTVVAALVTAGAIYDGGESATFSLLGQTIHTSVAGIFLSGVGTMVVFFLGLWMVLRALAHSRRKRHERKVASREQQQTVSAVEQERATLKAENERLAAQLSRESRPAIDETGDTTVLPATGAGMAGSGATPAGAGAATADGVPSDRASSGGRPAYPTDVTDTTPHDSSSSTSGRHGV